MTAFLNLVTGIQDSPQCFFYTVQPKDINGTNTKKKQSLVLLKKVIANNLIIAEIN